MPDNEPPRRSMVGVPPTRRARGGNTPAASSSTPSAPRSSARAAKRVKKEEPEEEEYKTSDQEKSEEEVESEDSGDEMTTPSRGKTPGAGKGKKKRVPLTDYHLKKKKILARKAAREAEKEREAEMEVEEVEKEPTPPPPRKPPAFSSYTPIQLMQDHIIRKLVEKDPDQYFSFPVTEAMAPGYSQIITKPMDMQTIREKIEDGLYPSLPLMKEDAQLIVANALQYNQPTTVFYLAAKRLSNLIAYYFGEQYLRFLFHSLPSANKIPFELVGIRPLATVTHDKPVNRRKAFLKDGMTSEDCLQSADAKIRDRLSAKLPDLKSASQKMAKLGFLSEKNGTVVLNVVAGGDSDKGPHNQMTSSENSAPRRVTLGDIVGPLEEGTTGMIQMADHRLFSQAPVNYLNYGPFSSFAPMYDSTWSTMTKTDTDMFLRVYGEKSNAAAAVSMRSFVENCPEFAEIVEKKLNGLTDDEHSKTIKNLNQEKDEIDDLMMENEEYRNQTVLSLLNDVTSISNFGIDVGFLKDIRQEILVPAPESEPPATEPLPEYMMDMNHMNVQQQLDHIGQEIKDLAHLQQDRLCQPPPQMLLTVPEPSPIEQKLAENVQQHLAHQMATHTIPEAFVTDAALHDAIGVDMDDGDLFSEFFVTQ
ncbi:CRE-TAG-298 protein [Caenorhabditis remanei]|uniref:CRE-TAG-298 protein n=1 Tax=Caenorhabditis remanei TaxID=31234 RepID=E3NGY7_CAERE|nr:CRE-TAG-298 protein [Caenorhabditis remanei]